MALFIRQHPSQWKDYFGEARVIRLQDIQQKIIEIKDQVAEKVTHPYLAQFIPEPYIDEDKLLLLVSILEQMDLSNSQLKNYAVTTMLIQIALDTHEHVSNTPIAEKEKTSQTTRQLTVLAGDYFSGLYYKILADSDEIPMINLLAQGIREVNEHKISVNQKEFDGIEKLMTSVRMIESSLISKLIDFFHLKKWNDVTANLLFIKRLLLEKNQYSHTGSSIVFEGLKKMVFPKNGSKLSDLSIEQKRYLMHICDRYIEFSKQMIEEAIKKLPGMSQLLESRIQSILNQHQPIAKTFVEEG